MSNNQGQLTYSSGLFSLLQNFGCALLQLSSDLTILEFNQEAEMLYGCKKADAINKNFFQFCENIQISSPIKDFSEVLSGKALEKIRQDISINHVTKSLQWTIAPVFSAGVKESVGISLIGMNLEPLAFVEDLKLKLEYFEHIINNVPHYLFWKNKDSIFLGSNEKFAKSAGLKSAEELIGKSDFDLPWSREESEAYIADDQRVMKSGKAKLNIEESQTVQDKQIVLLTSKVPLYDDNGNVSGVLGIYSDITERKQMEEELRRSKEAAEAASRAKTMFLANMSHDIKTPISGIISTAEYLTHATENLDFKDRADDIVQSGLRLLELMVEIIEVSRLEVRENTRTQIRFKLKQLVDDIIQLIRPATVDKSFKLILKYDKKIPNFLIGDRWHLYRVILNLLSNAIKFTSEGSITLRLKLVKQTKKAATIKISIIDTGIGIPKDKQAVIFDEFTRLTPSYEGIYKGTGLGLYIVKQFIEAMDGEVYVESEEGKGSAFTCVIPFKVPLLQEDADAKETQNLADNINFSVKDEKNKILAKNNFSGTRLLLVEDNVIAARAAKGTLQSLKCQVDVAKSGHEAIKFFKKNKYNLIYMDLGLPDLDGMEVARKLREIEGDPLIKIPIIALSAHIDENIKINCLNADMNGVFTKPLLMGKAKQILNAHLGGKTQDDFYDDPNKISSQQVISHVPDETKVIDLDLGASILGGDIDEAHKMLGMLIESFPENQRELESAYQKKDFQRLEKIAHRVHGGVSYTGAARLQKALRLLVDTIRENRLDDVDVLYKDVCHEVKQLVEAYHNL